MDSGSTLGCCSQKEKEIGTITLALHNMSKEASCIGLCLFQRSNNEVLSPVEMYNIPVVIKPAL
jgi:hypothetical protein